jgi:PAP2 superfamily
MEPIAQTIRRGLPWVVIPLLAASLVRLLLEPAYLSAPYAGWLSLLVLFPVVQVALLRKANATRIRLSLLANFIAISVGYQMIGIALNRVAGWRADELVYSIDCRVFGGDPQRFLSGLQAPWLSTAAMLGYLGFAGYLAYLFLSEAFVLSEATGRLQLGLMRLYGIGFSGYVLLPAAGPAFHHPSLLPPIAHSAFTARLDPWVLGNCSHVDVCPSLHAAICTFLLVWTYNRNRGAFLILVIPSAALLLGTVYFQYHYFTDLPCGIFLGAATALSIYHATPTQVLGTPRPAD